MTWVFARRSSRYEPVPPTPMIAIVSTLSFSDSAPIPARADAVSW